MSVDWMRLDRTLARFGPENTGAPLLLLTAGMHGNEPDGVQAVLRVTERLLRERIPLAGRLAAYLGNRAALAKNQRGLDEDLNRAWTRARIDEVRAGKGTSSESREARELLPLLERELASGASSVLHVDLHATSSTSPPFAICARTPECRAAALALGVPPVLGLEDLVRGTLADWTHTLGHRSVVLEGGRNNTPETVERLESLVWLALAAARVIEPMHVGDLAPHRARIARAVQGLPQEVELVHRHAIPHGEPFRMRPGYANFARVARGELLAHAGPDLAREVRAPWDALLVMPLYQTSGQDGFFLARPPDPGSARGVSA